MPTHGPYRVLRALPLFPVSTYAGMVKTIPQALKYECSQPAQFRMKVIGHTERYGWRAAKDAYNVGRSTIFLWRKKLRDGGGTLVSLIPKKTTPKNRRTMRIDPRFLSVIGACRETYGAIGKEKIKFLLDAYAISLGVPSYGSTKIGLIIKRYRFIAPRGSSMRRRRVCHGVRRKYAPRSLVPGHIETDCITLYGAGVVYRFVSMIDVATRFAWCQCVSSLSAANIQCAFQGFVTRYGYTIHTVQTDNGSEFLGVFHTFLVSQGITHEFIYPRSPKINGIVERFNRTVQEECINHSSDLGVDMEAFVRKLDAYCTWYNTKRPHYALKYLTPAAVLLQHTGGQR